MRAAWAWPALGLAACLSTACGPPVPRGAEEPAPAPGPARPQGPDPGALDQLTAVAWFEGAIHAGTEVGLVRLDPRSGAYRLLEGEAQAPFAAVAALAVGPEGRLWSAHRLDDGGVGGLRSLSPSGELRFEGLADDDVPSLAVSAARVVAATPRGVAWRRPDAPSADFELLLDAQRRPLEVVRFDDENGQATAHRVIEFRPRGERVLAVALDEPALWVGTTHGLYRLVDEELRRYEIPCRSGGRIPRRVEALAAGGGKAVASLVVQEADGGFTPGGLLELDASDAHRCLIPDLDVPASPSLGLALEADTIWLATYEGPTRIRGREAELLDGAAGAPRWPATAVGTGGPGGCLVGTWGGGAWHLQGRSWTSWSFRAGAAGTATVAQGELR